MSEILSRILGRQSTDVDSALNPSAKKPQPDQPQPPKPDEKPKAPPPAAKGFPQRQYRPPPAPVKNYVKDPNRPRREALGQFSTYCASCDDSKPMVVSSISKNKWSKEQYIADGKCGTCRKGVKKFVTLKNAKFS